MHVHKLKGGVQQEISSLLKRWSQEVGNVPGAAQHGQEAHRITRTDRPCLDREGDGAMKTLTTAEQRGCLPRGTSVCSLCSQAATESLPAARSNHCTCGPRLTQPTPCKMEGGRRPPRRAGPRPSARKPGRPEAAATHTRPFGNTARRDHSQSGQAF